jgi:hypothetical protein
MDSIEVQRSDLPANAAGTAALVRLRVQLVGRVRVLSGWKAGCGRSTCPVWREGDLNRISLSLWRPSLRGYSGTECPKLEKEVHRGLVVDLGLTQVPGICYTSMCW